MRLKIHSQTILIQLHVGLDVLQEVRRGGQLFDFLLVFVLLLLGGFGFGAWELLLLLLRRLHLQDGVVADQLLQLLLLLHQLLGGLLEGLVAHLEFHRSLQLHTLIFILLILQRDAVTRDLGATQLHLLWFHPHDRLLVPLQEGNQILCFWGDFSLLESRRDLVGVVASHPLTLT